MDTGAESRRSARTAGRFWVAVEGVDTELVPRRGDLSATGIFFETEFDIGEAGTVQWLHIASWDRVRTVTVMAHVVRAVTLADVHREIRGVALEFMPESDEAASNLCDLVRYVLEAPQERGEAQELRPRLAAKGAAASAGNDKETPVTVSKLSVQTMLLETDWTVPVGEDVRVEIIARGVRRPIRLEGRAVSVLPASPRGEKRYRIAVQVKSELQGPLRRFSSVAMPAVTPAMGVPAVSSPPPEAGPLDQLLSALIQPPETPPERGHLTGQLARIPFPALCSLMELERLGGVLTVRRPATAAATASTTRLYLREGRFVDVEELEGDGRATSNPRAELGKLLACREGSFEFDVGDTPREDRIQASMTQLLLDLARVADEEAESARR